MSVKERTVQIISRILGGVIVGVCGRRILISDDAACRIKVLNKSNKIRKKNERTILLVEGIVLSGCFRVRGYGSMGTKRITFF